MMHRVVHIIFFVLVSFVALVHSSEEGERAAKELSAKLFNVIPLNADWSFAKSDTGKTENGTKRTNYFYASRTKRRLLTISIIEQGHMPTTEPEAAEYIKRFEDLGYVMKGWRFVLGERNTFLVEEQIKVFNGVPAVATMVLIQGNGEIYNVSGTVVDDKSDIDERMRIISQVSFDGVALSEENLSRPKE